MDAVRSITALERWWKGHGLHSSKETPCCPGGHDREMVIAPMVLSFVALGEEVPRVKPGPWEEVGWSRCCWILDSIVAKPA